MINVLNVPWRNGAHSIFNEPDETCIPFFNYNFSDLYYHKFVYLQFIPFKNKYHEHHYPFQNKKNESVVYCC